ncbi:hypothetical protein BU23DRAFT_453931 [Bimuria novae-zelandiae CBS 107.79]|uniref:Bacteriocin-protection protein, YdeI/OmpD-associated family n=1 Tax=Bimuria novae-zelandiae CBS 107.79 TaxID=1447943 RepID=A0A6A5VIE5_9PLEO|nr:hypothetical protein BU23DRAFT_453931 [Bimuria novae-zelandiae CBS 107.79]
MPKELPILKLADATAWQQWLAREGPTSEGVMLATIKKDAKRGSTTLRYDQALEEALCYGWIDSGGCRVDDSIYLYRFCPRKADSLWSKRNVGYVERLEAEKRIQPAGRAAIELAKANGRWASAYSGSGNTEMPPDFLTALDKVPSAKATWERLNKGNRWRMYFRLNNLKTVTGREKRIQADIEMLARGETPIPQKRIYKTHPTRNETKKDESPVLVTDSNSGPSDMLPVHRKTRTGRNIPSYAE